MISKELFVKTLNNIQEQRAKNEKVGKALEEVCDSWVVFGTKDLYLESLLELLEAVFEDEDNQLIQWWLYEGVEKVVWFNDDRPAVDLSTPEALYDFLVYG